MKLFLLTLLFSLISLADTPPPQNISILNWPVTQMVNIASLPLQVSGPLTNAELRAAPIVISGAVDVSNFPASQAVTGTFWQATQPVSGTVNVGNFPGIISVSNFPASQPVTGTFWQTTQPVSIATMPSTPVTGTFWQATQPMSATSLPLPSGAATSANQTNGTQQSQIVDGLGGVVGTTNANGIIGLNVALSGTNFVTSVVNSSAVQLAAGATFTGAIETIFNQQSISINLTTDQPGTLTLRQYIDLAGTRQLPPIVIPVLAGGGLNRSYTGNGNYLKMEFHNTGASTTTTFNLYTAYGIIPTVTELGNAPVAINEIGGTQLTDGSLPMTEKTLYPSATGTITSTQSVSISIGGTKGLSVELSGTWTGTVTFEILIGSTWQPVDAFALSTELVSKTATVNGVHQFLNIYGASSARVRGATVATGTANVTFTANASAFNYPFYARGNGDTIGSYGLQVGGIDPGTATFQFQKVNTLGAAGVYIESSNKAAYRGAIIPVTPPSSPTDIVTLCGSATKIVRVTSITLGSTQTTQGINDWYLVKRSTANTGGTSTAIASVPLDSAFGAATAVMRRYTANPTLGTLVGNMFIDNILSPVVAPGSSSATSYTPNTWDFTNNPLVLRGDAECMAVNFGGAARPSGLSVNIDITWTEE